MHLAVALAFLLLTGCASTRAALPGWAPSFLKPTSIVVPAPASQPSSSSRETPQPAVVHAEAAPAAARPIVRWVGERFMVLPRPPSRQREPYEGLEVADKVRRHPTPAEIAGAVLTVTRIAYDRLVPLITFVRQDSGQQYTARAPTDVVEGLAPLADVESSQKEWRGKALWLATPNLNVTGDESADVHVLPVRRLSRVEVVDVQPGWSNLAPLRFMLKTTDGLLGFRDVHTTGTNVPAAERAHHAFERAFLTRDPRAEFDWPAEVWANIEDSRVVAGMTAAQARLSWGEPPRVERAISSAGREERWTYPGPHTLVLVDGLVTEVRP